MVKRQEKLFKAHLTRALAQVSINDETSFWLQMNRMNLEKFWKTVSFSVFNNRVMQIYRYMINDALNVIITSFYVEHL